MGEWVQNVQEFNLSRRLISLWLTFCTPMRYLSKHRNLRKERNFQTNIGANGFVFASRAQASQIWILSCDQRDIDFPAPRIESMDRALPSEAQKFTEYVDNPVDKHHSRARPSTEISELPHLGRHKFLFTSQLQMFCVF
jgi:hypothetical protein